MVAKASYADKRTVHKGVENLPWMRDVPKSVGVVKEYISDPGSDYYAYLRPKKVAIDILFCERIVVFLAEPSGKHINAKQSTDIHEAVPVDREAENLERYRIKSRVDMLPTLQRKILW